MDQQEILFQFDDVLVDLANERILRAGRPVVMEPKAFRVLVHLLQNRGRLIEKDELLAAVWRDTFVTENALTREIGLLRKALGDSKTDAKYIETVPTRGYRFIAKVTVRGADASGAADPALAAARLDSSSPASERDARWDFTRKGMVFGSAGLLVMAIFVVLQFSLGSGPPSKSQWLPLRPEQVQITTSSAADIFPSFSPDGATIAYSSNVSGRFEIYLKQLSPGGRVVQLTNDGGENLQPAWSPDGRTIAYYSQIKGGIWLMPALGGVARQVVGFGSGPSWSPDGEELVFQSAGIRDLSAAANVWVNGSTVWVSLLRDGSLRQVTRKESPAGAHNAPSWSPDGNTIVFVTANGTADEVWTVSPDGKNQRRIASHGFFYNPVYARNSRLIYVAAARGDGDFGIWAFPVAAKVQPSEEAGTRICNSLPALSRYLAISPDGKKIAYSNLMSTSNLVSIPISLATGEVAGPPVALTQDTRFRKTNPAFSADGRRFLFYVENIGSYESGIWIMDSDGEHPALATSSCENSGWLPAGKDFACFSRLNPNQPELLSVRLETGKSTPIRDLPPEAHFMRVSPSGKEVAFHSKKSGALNVWIAPLTGGEPRQLTFDTESMGYAAWSPDSNYLAFETQRGDDTHITVAPSTGGAPVQLTAEPGQSWAHSWSPDGDKIAFAALRNGVWNIRWVSRRGKMQKQVTQYSGSAHYVGSPEWSPLGNQIVYEYGETTGNIWLREIE